MWLGKRCKPGAILVCTLTAGEIAEALPLHFIYLVLGGEGVCTYIHVTGHMWKSENSLQELILSFHHARLPRLKLTWSCLATSVLIYRAIFLTQETRILSWKLFWFHFCCYNKTPWQNQLKEERVYLAYHSGSQSIILGKSSQEFKQPVPSHPKSRPKRIYTPLLA